MPIVPFNDLRNPYSVNQPTAVGGVTTGTGYGIIVRLVACSYHEWLTNSSVPTLFCNGTCNLGNTGISVLNWSVGTSGQPTDPTYTAFISQDDYLNSDMNQIAASPLIWEVGQNIFYSFEVDPIGHQVIAFGWEIIEVVDETTYAAGAGVPTGLFISQATYGDIPVGTITAQGGDPNCNGCSDLYNVLNVTTNQNETQNNVPGPWHELNKDGPMDNPNTSPNGFTGYIVDGVNGFLFENTCTGWLCMSRGMYIGTYAWIIDEQRACRNPNAWNFDKTTTNYFNTGTGPQYDFGRPFQLDCDGVVFDPSEPTGDNGFGDESCCIFTSNNPPLGCDDLNERCGCMNPTAANYDISYTHDCNDILNGPDDSCCEWFHEWKWCGSYGGLVIPPTEQYINFTGDWNSQWNSLQQNTPVENYNFMNYLIGINGSPWSTPYEVGSVNNEVPIGTIIQMRSMGMPGNWYCIEYMGPKNDTAANLHPGDGIHWNSNSWWNFPPALDGSNNLMLPNDCASCLNVMDDLYLRFKVCDGPWEDTYINIINDWATDPVDEQNNIPNNFWNSIDTSTFSCTQCNQTWLIVGMTLHIEYETTSLCLEYVGTSANPEGSSSSGWISGIGTGTDNFILVDPTNTTVLTDIFNTCSDCENSGMCTPICTDPASECYVAGPYNSTQCDCNGNSLPSNQALGWNDCCCPCDGDCDDPTANNYVQGATGCCGSGAGIGEPIVESGNAGCTNIVYSGTVEGFAQFVSEPANSLTGTNTFNLGFEDMSTVWYGGPIPIGACNGINGGFNYSLAAGFNSNKWTLSYTTWDLFLDACITGADSGTGGPAIIPGVTVTSTLSEVENLFNSAFGSTDASFTFSPIVCLCEYASYAQNYDCCTYNWECIEGMPDFGMSWPEPDTQVQKNKVIYEWNKKYPINSNSDFNPRPNNVWNHTEDIGYYWGGLEYLNISLRYSPIGNLGFNRNTIPGNQGWASGKQPKINQPNTIDNWRFATDFMDDLTASGSDSKGYWDKDLSKSYYRVKTNMISVRGFFKNPGSKLITEPIVGGTQSTGLYYLIVPTGLITIRKGFEAAFPNTSGKEFKTWRKFRDSLIADGLPNDLHDQNWTIISQWVLEYVKDFNTVNSNKEKASPEFVQSSMSWMVQMDEGCICIQDPNGPYIDQTQCETMLNVPGSGAGSNCCACIYGCTDPSSFNYDPLATCDDGSCLGCDPFIVRHCGSPTYSLGYLCNVSNCFGCSMTPQTCTNSQALINAWGLLNYGDVVQVAYDDSLNGNVCPPNHNACYQWIDPNDPQYLIWAGSNTTTALIISQQLALPNSGLTLVNTPYNNISYDTTCTLCGDILGCTDPAALNYNPAATVDDGSCEYCVYGCMVDTGLVGGFPDINGHGSNAIYDCAVSATIPTITDVCSYPCATGYLHSNYNPCATCESDCLAESFHEWRECVEADVLVILAPGAPNDVFAQQWFYDNVGSPNIGETIFMPGAPNICYEYMGPVAVNVASELTPRPLMIDWVYGTLENADCETCTCIYGCMDDTMCNYDPLATCDDGSCCNLTGCLDPAAFNYCDICCCAGPCTPIIYGCMDPASPNYNPLANTPCPDDCCFYTILGCIDPLAVNFNPLATVDDGSCTYLDQCKREPREFGADPTKKLNIECDFASDVYKEYRKQRYGLSNYCGSDLPDHLHEKALCDWEDSKRPAYLSSTLTVLDTYCYPIIDGEPDWFDPLRPTWTNENCGLSSDVDVDMYFAYDTTSMGLAAIQNQRMAIEDWLDDLAARDIPFGGQVYHTLVLGERWLDWGTSVFTGVWNNSGSCGGTDTGCTPGNPVDHGLCPSGGYSDAVTISSMSLTHRFWTAVAWGNITSREWYAAMPSTVTNGTLHHSGFPPALTKRQVLSVNFADESATGAGVGGTAQPYHIQPGPALYGTTTWTQATDGTGTTITACWKADYDEWISTYEAHLAKGPKYKATMVIYPARPLPTLSGSGAQTAFPLHVLGGVDSGNNLPPDGRYGAGTAPLSGIVNLVNIENNNPYWDTANPIQPVTHTFGYGGLDNYGWQANVREQSFDADLFKEDLEGYWDPKRLKCDDSECIVLNVVNQNNVAIPDYDIYVDGGFVGKTDEFGRLLFTIPNASVKTDHIINLCLCLVTTGNCCQQNIKIVVQEECPPECCTDPFGVNCDTYVVPVPQVFEGCMDPNASNYNPMATIDDGSCEYCDPPIIITETHINVSTPGASDGSITITVINGTLPYTFLWSNGAVTQNLTGLPGGLYVLTVTDANDCDSTIIVPINEDPDIYGCRDDSLGYWPNINGLNQAGVVCSYPCSDDGTDTGVPEGYVYFCFDPDATISADCCLAGCTDSSSTNWCPACGYDCNLDDINDPFYVPSLGWDSCCEECKYGCTNPFAGNYDPSADCDDDSCIFYFDCIEASWDVNPITGLNQLSNINTTGIFNDTTCLTTCDSSYFFAQMAIYYSSPPNQSIVTAFELTMVNAIGGTSMGFFNANECPACTLDFAYTCNMPLATIGGYTTENPNGPTGASSCYAAEQLADFGISYFFPTWAEYRDWHNNGTNTSNGPNVNCAGSQIPVILPGDNIVDVNTMHNSVNGGGSTPDNPDANDNWVYWINHVPACSGYVPCECVEMTTSLGTYPTIDDCETNTEDCCGSGSGEPIPGCIDNGFVGSHVDFGTYGATTEQEWWDGQNAAGIIYSMHSIPMTLCEFGIIHSDTVANGGSGTIGLGTPTMYPTGIPAFNYNPLATYDDGSCCYCLGCMDEQAPNYEPGACEDDPSMCTDVGKPGCMDPQAWNYDPLATIENMTCFFEGCMNGGAMNYLTFAINGLATYTGNGGIVYGAPSIQQPCSSCCIFSAAKFECIDNVPWDVYGPSTSAYPNFVERTDASRLHQCTEVTSSCQTMWWDSVDTNNNNNIWYMWSNTTDTVLQDFNQWFFWSPTLSTNFASQCTFTDNQLTTLYANTGWHSPANIGVFNIGFDNSNDSVVKTDAYPAFIPGVILYDNNMNIIHHIDYSSTDRTWVGFRDHLINNLGFDGTTYPDISGLDYHNTNVVLNALNPSFDINGNTIGFWNCTGSDGNKVCLKTDSGTHNTCIECSPSGICGSCDGTTP